MRLIAALLLLLSVPASAAECESQPYADQPAAYLRALVRSLTIASEAMKETHAPVADDDTARTRAVIARSERLKREYECAAAQVRPYTATSNRGLAISADTAASVFAMIAELSAKNANAHRMYLEGSVDLPRLLAFMEKGTELADGIWKMLPDVAVIASRALIDSPGHLAISEAERNELLASLHQTFGEEIENGVQVGQGPVVSTAAALYQFLSTEGWTYR